MLRPGKSRKKLLAHPHFSEQTSTKAAIRREYVTFSSRSLALSQASFTDRPLYLYLERDVLCAYSEGRSFSPHLSHKTSLLLAKTSLLLEKSAPLFQPRCVPRSRQGTKKGLYPNSLYSPLSFNPNMKQRFRLLRVARVYLVAPEATSKALFTAFCAPLAAAALALFTAAFAPLSTAFAPCCAAALAFVPTAFARFSTALAPC